MSTMVVSAQPCAASPASEPRAYEEGRGNHGATQEGQGLYLVQPSEPYDVKPHTRLPTLPPYSPQGAASWGPTFPQDATFLPHGSHAWSAPRAPISCGEGEPVAPPLAALSTHSPEAWRHPSSVAPMLDTRMGGPHAAPPPPELLPAVSRGMQIPPHVYETAILLSQLDPHRYMQIQQQLATGMVTNTYSPMPVHAHGHSHAAAHSPAVPVYMDEHALRRADVAARSAVSGGDRGGSPRGEFAAGPPKRVRLRGSARARMEAAEDWLELVPPFRGFAPAPPGGWETEEDVILASFPQEALALDRKKFNVWKRANRLNLSAERQRALTKIRRNELARRYARDARARARKRKHTGDDESVSDEGLGDGSV